MSFVNTEEESLKPLLELPNGCPSVDTIERVISRIDPAAFAECLSVFGNFTAALNIDYLKELLKI